MTYKCIFISLFISLNFFFSNSFFGQTASFQELDSKAKKFLDEKNYEKAYDLYSELLVYYPSDPKVNYGYGVSGVQTGRYNQKVRDALQIAMNASQSKDACFYLGKAFHANEAWDEAQKFYTQFERLASKRMRKRFYTQKMIDLCKQKKNPFKNDMIDDIDTKNKSTYLVNEQLPSQILPDDSDKIISKINTRDFSIPASLESQKFNFRIDDQRTYTHLSNFETEEGRTEFTKGWFTQMEIDSIENSLENKRKTYESEEDPYQKELLASKIISLEKESDFLQNKKQNHFQRALNTERHFWSPQTKLETKSTYTNSNISSPIKEEKKAEKILSESKDNAPASGYVFKPIKSLSESINNSSTETVSPSLEKEELLNESEEFELMTPKVVYKVQIGAFKETLSPDKLDALERKYPEEIFGVYNHKGFFCITIGEKTSYQEAVELLQKYQEEGYALFIVAFKNSKRIPIKEAIAMN